MPSPFPGMDPYLEGNEWHSFHIELSVAIRQRLTPQVKPKYVVRATPRFIVDVPESVSIGRRDIYPDTAVAREAPPVWAVSTAPAPVEVLAPIPTEIPHYVVEIHTADGKELVTTIEVLSPANKRGRGYAEYLEKRLAILLSSVHLIEIDWLRQGRRVPMASALPEAPYYIFLSRAEKRPVCDVWPIQLYSKLPTVPVPLLPGDADAELDCQEIFESLYDSLDYGSILDYTRPPEITLEGDTAVIAATLLQQAGISSVKGP